MIKGWHHDKVVIRPEGDDELFYDLSDMWLIGNEDGTNDETYPLTIRNRAFNGNLTIDCSGAVVVGAQDPNMTRRQMYFPPKPTFKGVGFMIDTGTGTVNVDGLTVVHMLDGVRIVGGTKRVYFNHLRIDQSKDDSIELEVNPAIELVLHEPIITNAQHVFGMRRPGDTKSTPMESTAVHRVEGGILACGLHDNHDDHKARVFDASGKFTTGDFFKTSVSTGRFDFNGTMFYAPQQHARGWSANNWPKREANGLLPGDRYNRCILVWDNDGPYENEDELPPGVTLTDDREIYFDKLHDMESERRKLFPDRTSMKVFIPIRPVDPVPVEPEGTAETDPTETEPTSIE